jgi:hypothetical protein
MVQHLEHTNHIKLVGGKRNVLRPLIQRFGLLPAAHCPDALSELDEGWGEGVKTQVYLDIGVGQGHTTKAVAELLQAKEVWGLDVAVFPLNFLECTLQYDGERPTKPFTTEASRATGGGGWFAMTASIKA